MLKRITFWAFSSLLILSACSIPEQVTGPKVSAVNYIDKTNLGSNLYSMSYRAAQITETYRIIVSKLGAQEAKSILRTELLKHVELHQGQWNENLANSYLEYLTLEEINSLYYNNKNSPYANKKDDLMLKISASMQKKSEDILRQVVADSLYSSFSSL